MMGIWGTKLVIFLLLIHLDIFAASLIDSVTCEDILDFSDCPDTKGNYDLEDPDTENF